MADTPKPPLFSVLISAIDNLLRVMDVWRNCGKVERPVATRIMRCCSDASAILRRLAELAEKGPIPPYQPRRRKAPPEAEAAAEDTASDEAAPASEAASDEATPASEQAAPEEAAHAPEAQASEAPAAETPTPQAQPAQSARPRRKREESLPRQQAWLLKQLKWDISVNKLEMEAALVTEDAITAMQASADLCRLLTTICHALNIDKSLIKWPPGTGPKRPPKKTRRPRKKRGPSPAHRRREAYYAMDVGRGPEERYPRPPSPKLPLSYFHRKYFPR